MEKKEVLLSLSRVRPEEMDTVKRSHSLGRRRAFHILMEAQRYWSNMSAFRLERERNKRYTYGDQWGDIVHVDCEDMTEEEYIKRQGSVPLKNNLIRRLVKNVLGVYRSQSKEPICTARDRDENDLGETMTTILQYNMQTNRMNEIHARSMEEYLISGFVVHRKWYGWQAEKNRLDCWTDYVQPNNFFIDSNMRDFRGWDCNCVGEVHDVSFETVCAKFAHDASDYTYLSYVYKNAHDRNYITDNCERFGYSHLKNYDFLFTSDVTRCRVIEVWRRESKPRYRCLDYNTGDVFKCEVEDYDTLVTAVNESRLQRAIAAGMNEADVPLIRAEWFMDEYWYYYYLTPFGDILDEGETPYAHKSHPYVFKAYPFIDGEIHSFVADVIDQQRYTNRLVTLYDWIMRASAKGVLLVPEDSLPSGMSIEDIAEEWSRFNGVIMYRAKAGVTPPQQVAANSTNIGIGELLNIQLKFFEDISGVHGALQGRQGQSGTSGTLYAQQAQNAATSLLDILDSYSTFIVDGAYKDVKNIQQFYDAKRTFNIVGKHAKVVYDPQKIRDVDFDLSITESTTTPAYRQMANDFLIQVWSSGQITLEQLLEVGQFPFGDELLQSIRSQREQLEQGQVPEGIASNLRQQVEGAADMNAVNKAYQALHAA